jgi:arylsulfatase A-like enzyme
MGLFVLAATPWGGAEEPKRPNVLWIMSDDLRPQLGCYGDPVVKSPHLDSLSSSGLQFDRAYVQCAICSPSRNSMLSGLRPNTTGLRGFGTRVRDAVPDIVTLPQHFKNNGYHVRGFGKIFHIYAESMLGSEDDPESWSVPLQLPTVPVWGPQQNRLRDRLIDEALAQGKRFSHPHDWPRAETWDDSDVADDEMQDGNITAMAETFLRTRRGNEEPFFLAVGFLRPHLPFNAPRRYWDLYDPEAISLPEFRQLPHNAPRWAVTQGIVKNYYNMPPFESIDERFLRRYTQAYLACISYVDACVGRLLAALQHSGHAENTIVVFLGDHGYQMGEYDSWGHKHSNFEISTRAPLIMRSPGMRDPGRRTRQVTEFLDLYPTLCDLAQLAPPNHLEGRSFARLMDDPGFSHREAAFSEMVRGKRIGRSLRNGDFRYTEWRDDLGKVVATELYDHRNDDEVGVLETTNVVESPAFRSVIGNLSGKLSQILPAGGSD